MAVRFAGSAQSYLTTSDLPAGDLTICGWVMLRNDRNVSSIVFFLRNGSNGFSLETSNVGNDLSIDTLSGPSSTGWSATVNTWYRFAITRSGSSLVLSWGEAGAALTSASAITYAVFTPTQLFIGDENQASGSNARWDGLIANFKQYDTVLTLGEIEGELSQYVPQRTANLRRWHPFLVNETVDYSGLANTLSAAANSPTIEDGPPIRWARARGPYVKMAPSAVDVFADTATPGFTVETPTSSISAAAGTASLGLTCNEPDSAILSQSAVAADLGLTSGLSGAALSLSAVDATAGLNAQTASPTASSDAFTSNFVVSGSNSTSVIESAALTATSGVVAHAGGSVQAASVLSEAATVSVLADTAHVNERISADTATCSFAALPASAISVNSTETALVGFSAGQAYAPSGSDAQSALISLTGEAATLGVSTEADAGNFSTSAQFATASTEAECSTTSLTLTGYAIGVDVSATSNAAVAAVLGLEAGVSSESSVFASASSADFGIVGDPASPAALGEAAAAAVLASTEDALGFVSTEAATSVVDLSALGAAGLTGAAVMAAAITLNGEPVGVDFATLAASSQVVVAGQDVLATTNDDVTADAGTALVSLGSVDATAQTAAPASLAPFSLTAQEALAETEGIGGGVAAVAGLAFEVSAGVDLQAMADSAALQITSSPGVPTVGAVSPVADLTVSSPLTDCSVEPVSITAPIDLNGLPATASAEQFVSANAATAEVVAVAETIGGDLSSRATHAVLTITNLSGSPAFVTNSGLALFSVDTLEGEGVRSHSAQASLAIWDLTTSGGSTEVGTSPVVAMLALSALLGEVEVPPLYGVIVRMMRGRPGIVSTATHPDIITPATGGSALVVRTHRVPTITGRTVEDG